MQQLESRALKDSIDADWRLPKFETLKYDYKPLKEINPKNGFLKEKSLDFRLDQDLDYYSYKKDVVFYLETNPVFKEQQIPHLSSYIDSSINWDS